jgi:hypothetical protein
MSILDFWVVTLCGMGSRYQVSEKHSSSFFKADIILINLTMRVNERVYLILLFIKPEDSSPLSTKHY